MRMRRVINESPTPLLAAFATAGFMKLQHWWFGLVFVGVFVFCFFLIIRKSLVSHPHDYFGFSGLGQLPIESMNTYIFRIYLVTVCSEELLCLHS